MLNAEKYMETRCPAWCDRIVFSHDLNDSITSSPSPVYDMVGQNACMGDHKVN